jgi:5-methylcytosine-specific restriction protein A
VPCAAAGLLEPATVVDHVVPHRGDPVLFWNETNWQGQCKPCHDAKTAREGRWG